MQAVVAHLIRRSLQHLAKDRERIGRLCLHGDHHLRIISASVEEGTQLSRTNEQEQPFGGCYFNVGGKRSHPTYNGTHEVDVENGPDVYHMKYNSNGQEARSSESRH